MRGNNQRLYAIGVVCVSVCFAFIVGLSHYQRHCTHSGSRTPGILESGGFGTDLSMRWGEVACAIKGINSFHIWTHELDVPGYKPLTRPDKLDVNKPGHVVHAYPPWHHVYFGFYGLISEAACHAMFIGLNVVVLVFLCFYTFRLFEKYSDEPEFWTLCVALLMVQSVISCMGRCNYGLLILGSLVLMYRLIDKGWFVSAGFCWSVMMIKPQLAVLFFWPLLFGRKYKVICSAVIFCVCSTLVMAVVYSESPIKLLLQVPQIGLPYKLVNFYEGCVISRCGDWVQSVWMIVLFAVCGIVSWFVRHKQDWIERCLPAICLIPFWAYFQPYDRVMLWGFYVVVFVKIISVCERQLRNKWIMYIVMYLITGMLCLLWNVLSGCGWFAPSGIGWIYRLVEFIQDLVIICVLIDVVRSDRQNNLCG